MSFTFKLLNSHQIKKNIIYICRACTGASVPSEPLARGQRLLIYLLCKDLDILLIRRGRLAIVSGPFPQASFCKNSRTLLYKAQSCQ